MDSMSFITSLLAVSAAMQHAQAVEYNVTNRAQGTPGGTRFDKEIGISYILRVLDDSSNFILKAFRQSTEGRKDVRRVDVFIDKTVAISYTLNNVDGVSYTRNNEIHVSANYISSYTGDLRREITGILYHEVTHIWQWNGGGHAPDGLIEGMADYMRFKAGYAPSIWKGPGQGERWDQGHEVTAWFLDYCNGLRDGFVADLNRKMKDGYTDNFFVELLGKTVEQLWREYKAKYGLAE